MWVGYKAQNHLVVPGTAMGSHHTGGFAMRSHHTRKEDGAGDASVWTTLTPAGV